MKYCYTLISILVVLASCDSQKPDFEDLSFSVIHSIHFENEQYSCDGFEFGLIEDSLIYAYDIMNAVIFKYDYQGNLLNSNRFQNGINEVNLSYLGDLYPVNVDSIYVLEIGYGKLLLLDSQLKIRDSWNIYKLIDGQAHIGANKTQIIHFEYEDGEPVITLTASSREYYSSEKEHYKSTFLALKVNLKTGESTKLFRYPVESPYQENLFWGDEDPYFIYDNGKYYASFTFDPNVYLFTENSNEYSLFKYYGGLNKNSKGVQFGMNQADFIRDHQLEVYHNQNDYNLISKNLLVKSGKKYFARAVRKAMMVEEKATVSDIMATNNLNHDYILQIVDLDQDSPEVWKEFLLPKEYKNFSYIDQMGRFYLKRLNMETEEHIIDVVRLDLD